MALTELTPIQITNRLREFVNKTDTFMKNVLTQFNRFYDRTNDKIKEAYFVHFFLKDKLPNNGENVQELMEIVQ